MDPIVDEIRRIREEQAARFDFDIQRIIADARRRQEASQRKLVSFEKGAPEARPTESSP